jgi:hypothetical protein
LLHVGLLNIQLPLIFLELWKMLVRVDLDWYWRAWFYDIEPVDVSVDSVKAYTFINNKEVPVKIDDTMRIYPRAKDTFEPSF